MWGEQPVGGRQRIIEALAGSAEPLTTSAVARRAGLYWAQARELLNELRSARIIQRSRSGGERRRRGVKEFRWRLRPGGPPDGESIA